MSQCRERLQTQTRTIGDNRKARTSPRLSPPLPPFFLIFYRSPAIHPTISVNLNLAQTTRASSILARHFPRGIKLKIESKFRASFFFFRNCNTRIADQTTRNYSFKLHLLYSLFLYLTFLSASSVLFIIKIQRK